MDLRIHGYSIMTEYKKTYKKGTYGKKESRNYESTDSRKHIVWINGITETRSEDLRIYEMAEGQVSDISINWGKKRTELLSELCTCFVEIHIKNVPSYYNNYILKWTQKVGYDLKVQMKRDFV